MNIKERTNRKRYAQHKREFGLLQSEIIEKNELINLTANILEIFTDFDVEVHGIEVQNAIYDLLEVTS